MLTLPFLTCLEAKLQELSLICLQYLTEWGSALNLGIINNYN